MTSYQALHSEHHVLVVDDNPANCKLTCQLLKHLGISSTSTTDGYKALALCKEVKFNLILMDLQMPGLNGIETTAEIRKNEGTATRRTPIAVLTAEAVEEQKIHLLLADMDDFLCKPITENDLKAVTDRWLSPQQKSIPSSNITTQEQEHKNNTNKEASIRNSNGSPLAVFNLSESLKLTKQLPDLASDMLNFLLDSLDETKKSLERALNKDDMKTLLEVTHKFHGGCCYCGVPSLRGAVKALETELNSNSKQNIKRLTQAVIDEMDKLDKWAEEHDIEALFQEI